MPRPTINPEQLEERFRAARRMPELLQICDQVRTALRQVSDAMDDDGTSDGDQSEYEHIFATLKGLLDRIGTKISRQALVDDLDRRQAGIPLGGTGDRQWDQRLVEYRIAAAIFATLGPDSGVDAGPERETSAELARRAGVKPHGFYVPRAALSLRLRDCPPDLVRRIETRDVISTTTAGGGSIIPTVIDPQQWIDPLRAATRIRSLGATVISDLSANLDLPRMSKSASSGWFAENTPIIRTNQEFDAVELRPRHVGGIVEWSRNMAQQAIAPGIEAVVRRDLAMVLAEAVDTAAIAGAGDGVEPLGIITDPAVPFLPAAAPTYDGLVDLSNLLALNNALEGSLGWLSDATVRGQLLKLADGIQRPFGLDLLFQNFRYEFSNLATSVANPHPIIFGDFSNLVIGEWSFIDVLTNPFEGEAFSRGNILVRAAATIDVVKRWPQSFAWMGTTEPPPPPTTQSGGITNTGTITPPASRSRSASA